MSDPRIIGYLSRAVAHELSAVQHYLSQARLTAFWGMEAFSRELRQEADEELVHADRFITRLLQYGVSPKGGSLSPARLGRSQSELLLQNIELERDAVRLYEEAADYCRRRGALADAELFEAVRDEELDHLRGMEQQLYDAADGGRHG
ncbi:bacterioferritin [Methylonatrum kenyense]|uniref:ferritin-like domain-containing protein n=1 Tax=Methylonatrum kenyense TaxID=455253 RepID=UPI0020BE6A3F|nr:ferritin-like domain-containing protein [Methylonatrum kenyense]MCK8515638.1 bacterioferritin [Methylonatrum kenyense]